MELSDAADAKSFPIRYSTEQATYLNSIEAGWQIFYLVLVVGAESATFSIVLVAPGVARNPLKADRGRTSASPSSTRRRNNTLNHLTILIAQRLTLLAAGRYHLLLLMAIFCYIVLLTTRSLLQKNIPIYDDLDYRV